MTEPLQLKGTPSIWQATCNFRWKKLNGVCFDVLPFQLQQAYVCIETGETKWEKVPVVEEDVP